MTNSTHSGAENMMDFEHWPPGEALDETDVSLRAYVSRLPEAQLVRYDPAWTDEQVIEWDGNFRVDGSLMLVCCERDVDVHEFRRVLEAYFQFRESVKRAQPGGGAN